MPQVARLIVQQLMKGIEFVNPGEPDHQAPVEENYCNF